MELYQTLNPAMAIQSLKAPTESILNNTYVSGVIKILIILYAALAAPKLPTSISKYFHHPMVQIIIFALIAYTATKDISVSLLIAIAFFISFHSYTRNILSKVASNTKKLFSWGSKEKYSNLSMSTIDTLSSSTAPTISTKASNESSAINFAKIIGHDEDSSVESGLTKDSNMNKSEISDAALLDPYKASMVPVSDMPGYKL